MSSCNSPPPPSPSKQLPKAPPLYSLPYFPLLPVWLMARTPASPTQPHLISHGWNDLFKQSIYSWHSWSEHFLAASPLPSGKGTGLTKTSRMRPWRCNAIKMASRVQLHWPVCLRSRFLLLLLLGPETQFSPFSWATHPTHAPGCILDIQVTSLDLWTPHKWPVCGLTQQSACRLVHNQNFLNKCIHQCTNWLVQL